jgi:hypothetical protein
MIAYDRLQNIIPADQALANKALATSLQQIAGISNMNLPTLARSVSGIQTTKDLPLITAQTTAVPPAVANYYTSTLSQGSGPNGQIRIVDVLGIAIGWNINDSFIQTAEIFSTMDLSYLTLIYQTIAKAGEGDYGDPGTGPLTIPSGLPGAGTYYGTPDDPGPPPVPGETAFAAAMAVIYPLIEPAINNLIATYPTQTTELNTLWNGMCQQIIAENAFQAQIKLVWADLTANDRNSIYGFIFNLPNYGLQTEVGGMFQFLESLADLTTQGGQAIVGCLRDGQNKVVLGNAGIYTNANIPADPIPPPPEAQLLPGTYSSAEADSLVIK